MGPQAQSTPNQLRSIPRASLDAHQVALLHAGHADVAPFAATRRFAGFVECTQMIVRPGVEGRAESSTLAATEWNDVRRLVNRRGKVRPVALLKKRECQLQLIAQRQTPNGASDGRLSCNHQRHVPQSVPRNKRRKGGAATVLIHHHSTC